jgi:hypothetical protein
MLVIKMMTQENNQNNNNESSQNKDDIRKKLKKELRKKYEKRIIDLEALSADEFIESLFGYPFQKIIIKSLDLKSLALLIHRFFLERDSNNQFVQKQIEEKTIQVPITFEQFVKIDGEIQEYVLSYVDRELVSVLKKVERKYKVIFDGFYLHGLINFLLAEFLINILENDPRFQVVKKELIEKLSKKNYPIFIRINKNPFNPDIIDLSKSELNSKSK